MSRWLDAQANLQQQEAILSQPSPLTDGWDRARLQDLREALTNFLAAGGGEPDWPACPKASLHYEGHGLPGWHALPNISAATRALAKVWHEKMQPLNERIGTPQPLPCEERFQGFLSEWTERTPLEVAMLALFEASCTAYKTDFLIDLAYAGLDEKMQECGPAERKIYWYVKPCGCGSYLLRERDLSWALKEHSASWYLLAGDTVQPLVKTPQGVKS